MCINLVSLSRDLVFNEALVGFVLVNGPLIFEERTIMRPVGFAEVEVGQPILCESVVIAEDNIAERNQTSSFSAFVEGPPSIAFTPEGREATVTVIDNDGTSQHNYFLDSM